MDGGLISGSLVPCRMLDGGAVKRALSQTGGYVVPLDTCVEGGQLPGLLWFCPDGTNCGSAAVSVLCAVASSLNSRSSTDSQLWFVCSGFFFAL